MPLSFKIVEPLLENLYLTTADPQSLKTEHHHHREHHRIPPTLLLRRGKGLAWRSALGAPP
ncbi:MAG: hypothetical protein K9N62_18540, partial [Verrucomicrobia bacterium]|nr:hypothetical protein [Verrucomicrobiota bacterium]